MSDEPREFDFYVGGIEDGIIQALSESYLKTPGNPDGYLKRIGSYGGELDEQTLRKYVQQLAPDFPLMLVSYGDGEDKNDPPTAIVFDEPRIFRHDCTFSVICCSSDARSEQARRRGAAGGAGVYKMVADVRKALAGLRLKKEGELLTLDPLTVSGVQYLARLPELTAYAAHFDTYFKWMEPDRRGETIDVSELIFEAGSTGGLEQPGTLPGVIVK
jgi:hypothetical protein